MEPESWVEMVLTRGAAPLLIAAVYVAVGATVIRRSERGAGLAIIATGACLVVHVGLTFSVAGAVHWMRTRGGPIDAIATLATVIGLARWVLYVVTVGGALVAAVRLSRAVRAAELARARR